MNKQLEIIIMEYARKYFKECGKYIIDSNGGVDFEVYTDYNDIIADDVIEKAFSMFSGNAQNVRDYLCEHIFECYNDYICDLENDISNEVANYIENNVGSDTYNEIEKASLEVEDIRVILIDNNLLNVHIDYDDILSRSSIDLIISLENEVSKNHEFTLNNFNGNVLDWIENTQEAIDGGEICERDISLITLLKAQGYTFSEFYREAHNCLTKDNYKPKSKLISSLLDECYNTTSMCNALIFLKSVNLKEYLVGQKLTVIEKGTPCGYVDFVYGGGSTINIVLEKNLSLESVQHEKFVDSNKYGYSFKSIYGEFIR